MQRGGDELYVMRHLEEGREWHACDGEAGWEGGV